MIDKFQLSQSLRTAYAYACMVFVLGFFLSFDDNAQHALLMYCILLPFPLIAKDVWSQTRILRHPIFYWMLAYIFYMGLSGLWTPSDEMAQSLSRPFTRGFYIIIFCIAVAWMSERYPILFARLLTLLVAAAGIVALISIIVWGFEHGLNFSKRLHGVTRASHAIQGAASFAVVFFISLLRIGRQHSGWMNLFYGIVAFLCLTVVVLAQTRGVLIAMSAAVVVWLILKREFKPVIILALIATAVIIVGAFWLDWGLLTERLTRSMPFRMEIWQYVFNEFLNKPWFGHGTLHNSEVAVQGKIFDHAHNIYLATLFHGGILGLILYTGMVLTALYYAYINRAQEKYLFALIVLIFASVAMLSDVGRVIVSPRDVWFYFWFPIAIILSTMPLSLRSSQ